MFLFRKYWQFVVLAVTFIIVCLVWYEVFVNRPHQLRFAMLDIGQGDALYIEGPNGNQVIVDGGPGDALLSQLSKVMPFFDRSIDLIVNTNPDKDHFEGFIPLLDRYKVGAFVESGTEASTNPLWSELKKKIVDKNIPDIIAKRGQRIDLGDGAYIDILFPDRDVSGLAHNDGSIVARLVYGSTSVLLTGDSTQNIERYLISVDQTSLNSDILKVGHHGSKTSTSEDLVKAVTPDVALISAGKNNMYGHPNKEILDTLDKYKVPYLITFNEGLIEFDSDGQQFVRIK